jgi:hypothetical protein
MRTLVALASFAVVIAVAAPVQADPASNDPDASFLAALDRAGVPYNSGPVAVAVGKRECQLMDQGYSEVDVIKSVSAENPGFTMPDARKFTVIATGAYCPQHLGEPTRQPPSGIWPDFPWPGLPAAR